MNNNYKFNLFIDSLVIDVITSGITTFDKMLISLPAIYPTDVLNSMRRLVASKAIHPEILDKALKSTQFSNCVNVSEIKNMDVILPIPHPLDYEWRYNSETISHLLNRILRLTSEEDVILLLGTPSMMIEAINKKYPRTSILIDNNPVISDLLPCNCINYSVKKCDLRTYAIEEYNAKIVLCDSPWYVDFYEPFLCAACKACSTGGYVYLSVPPIGIRPNIDSEVKEIINFADRIGLSYHDHEHNILRYISPLFEINALRAAGIYNIPKEWRCGDLLTFKRTRVINFNHNISTDKFDNWNERIIGGVRIRYRKHSDTREFKNPSLSSLIPGDILPSVSRREEIRNRADVWTSGNRIYSCEGLNIFSLVLDSIVRGDSPEESVSGYLKKALLVDEIEIINGLILQIKEIINLEQKEFSLYETY